VKKQKRKNILRNKLKANPASWICTEITRWIRHMEINEKIKAVFWIRIWRIRTFLGLLDPDPLVRGRYESESFYHQAKIVRKP
jgi:hypothetical protein